MNPNHLPPHWQIKKLGEVCEKISLNKIKIKQKDYLLEGKYPIVDQGQDLIGGYYNDEKLLVPSVPPYIVFGDHTKIKKYIDFRFIPGADGVKVLKPNKEFNSRFFYYSLFTLNIPDKGYARHFQYLENSNIPLPPLPEQEAIVAKIESLFADLDAGKAALLAAREQIKLYRQSLLKAAFEGKLTDSGQKSVETGQLPEGWKMVKLGEVCEKIQDGSHFSPKEQYLEPRNGRYLYITAKNIRNGYMDFKNLVYVNKDFFDSIYSRCNPVLGDILLTKDGVNAGDITLNSIEEPFALLSSVCLIKSRKQLLLPKFIVYYFQSSNGKTGLIGDMTGTAIKRIILKKIKELDFPLPPLPIQEQIVAILEQNLSDCDGIDKVIDQSLADAELMRQSILKEAFEGRLVKIVRNLKQK